MSTPYCLLCLYYEKKGNWFLERKQIISADKSLCNQILKIETSRLLPNIIQEFEKLYCSKLEDKAPSLTQRIC